jgi:hypothetical protein
MAWKSSRFLDLLQRITEDERDLYEQQRADQHTQ